MQLSEGARTNEAFGRVFWEQKINKKVNARTARFYSVFFYGVHAKDKFKKQGANRRVI